MSMLIPGDQFPELEIALPRGEKIRCRGTLAIPGRTCFSIVVVGEGTACVSWT
jgi:hypothetical protein